MQREWRDLVCGEEQWPGEEGGYIAKDETRKEGPGSSDMLLTWWGC
jgi:hypothetical protein